MPLAPMSPGGQWFMSPLEGMPVYVPAKQLEAHRKRLVADDGWTPIADPRREEDYPAQQTIPVEVAMQSRIDQQQAEISELKRLVQQLLALKSEEATNGQTHEDPPMTFPSGGQTLARGKSRKEG